MRHFFQGFAMHASRASDHIATTSALRCPFSSRSAIATDLVRASPCCTRTTTASRAQRAAVQLLAVRSTRSGGEANFLNCPDLASTMPPACLLTALTCAQTIFLARPRRRCQAPKWTIRPKCERSRAVKPDWRVRWGSETGRVRMCMFFAA